MKRLTPEPGKVSSRKQLTVNVTPELHVRLRAIARDENAPVHKVITGLIDYYEANEDEIEAAKTTKYRELIEDYQLRNDEIS